MSANSCLQKGKDWKMSQIRLFFHLKSTHIFLYLHKNIDFEYSLEVPRQGASDEYPQSFFCGEIRKHHWDIIFYLELWKKCILMLTVENIAFKNLM